MPVMASPKMILRPLQELLHPHEASPSREASDTVGVGGKEGAWRLDPGGPEWNRWRILSNPGQALAYRASTVLYSALPRPDFPTATRHARVPNADVTLVAAKAENSFGRHPKTQPLAPWKLALVGLDWPCRALAAT